MQLFKPYSSSVFPEWRTDSLFKGNPITSKFIFILLQANSFLYFYTTCKR